MSGLRLEKLAKSLGGAPVLKGVSLHAAEGEFLTLLGPSGCGKSTLLRIIAGLDIQDAGSVSIGARTVDGLRPKQRDVAMVFQSYALYPHMTVSQNMALPLRMRRLSYWQRLPLLGKILPGTRSIESDIAGEVGKVADAIGIGSLLSRKPGQLSGGQRQRVAVGRAMVRRPSVFLMDEPLSNLDAKLRVQMRAEIKDLHRRLGVTFIYVTHDQAEAMTLSDRVAVMFDGEILQIAAPQDIYADPAHRRVAEFIGSPKINLLEGKMGERSIVSAAGTTLQASAAEIGKGEPVTLGIRPEAFELADGAGAGILSGTIRLIEHLAPDVFVHLDIVGVAEPVVARLHPGGSPDLAIGKMLHLGVRPERILLFDRAGHQIKPAGPTIAMLRRSA